MLKEDEGGSTRWQSWVEISGL